MKASLRSAALAAALVGLAPPTDAATRTWPNLFGPTCSGTLQACIDGAAPGDIVQIGADDAIFPDRYTLVDENVIVRASLTLRAAPGIDAVFAASRSVLVDTPLFGAYTVEVQGLVFARGSIEVRHNTALESTYRVERNRFADVSPGTCAIAMRAGTGTPRATFVVGDNVVRTIPGGAASNGICVTSLASNRQDVIFRNRIEAAPARINVGIAVNGGAPGSILVQQNTVVGSTFTSGIQVGDGGPTGRQLVQIDENAVTGQDADPATLGAGVLVLAADAALTIANNTIVHGFKGLVVGSFVASPSVNGTLANNVVAFHASEGLVVTPTLEPAVGNRNNLVFGNASNAYTPGPGTRTVDPQLVSRTYPRLRDSSPAINAGDNASVPAFSAFDADGERRIVLGFVDIGAYEANAELAGVETATPDNSVANTVEIGVLGQLVDVHRLQVTPHRVAAAGATLRQHLGVYLPFVAPATWAAYFEDPLVTVPLGYRFSVLAPAGSKTAFQHTSSASTVVGETTRLDHPELDGRSFAIAAITHRFPDGGGASDYHSLPIGLEYFGSRWLIRNEDLAEMRFNRPFNVAIAPLGSPNAFRVTVPGALSELRLDHPLLDDNGCAAPIVSRVDDPTDVARVFNTLPYTIEHRAGAGGAPGRWFVVAEGDGTPVFPVGASFNVIVDGQQANRCRAPAQTDALFSDGYE